MSTYLPNTTCGNTEIIEYENHYIFLTVQYLLTQKKKRWGTNNDKTQLPVAITHTNKNNETEKPPGKPTNNAL